MSFNMNNMGNLLKKMQDDMARVQKELEEAEISGSDPSGKVTCKVNGKRDVLEVKIDPAVIDPSDPEMLEDLVLFAVRDAMGKADKFSAEKMGEITKGLPPIPGLQMPF
jgi:nucleoid-associated protein EbfC